MWIPGLTSVLIATRYVILRDLFFNISSTIKSLLDWQIRLKKYFCDLLHIEQSYFNCRVLFCSTTILNLTTNCRNYLRCINTMYTWSASWCAWIQERNFTMTKEFLLCSFKTNWFPICCCCLSNALTGIWWKLMFWFDLELQEKLWFEATRLITLRWQCRWVRCFPVQQPLPASPWYSSNRRGGGHHHRCCLTHSVISSSLSTQ